MRSICAKKYTLNPIFLKKFGPQNDKFNQKNNFCWSILPFPYNNFCVTIHIIFKLENSKIWLKMTLIKFINMFTFERECNYFLK